MKRHFFTGVKVTEVIKNPIVYCVGVSEDAFTLLRSISRSIKGTWGHSEDEVDYNLITGQTIYRKYFAFEHELDAMQFLLTAKDARRVKIWPSKLLFTVHQIAESEI